MDTARIIAALAALALLATACGDEPEQTADETPSPEIDETPSPDENDAEEAGGDDADGDGEEADDADDSAPAGEATPAEEPTVEPSPDPDRDADDGTGDDQPPIVIESPAPGEQRKPGAVTASGSSVTFESTVELRLIDPDGEVVEDTFTTAEQPDVAERGPWEHTFETEATTSGTWTVEAEEPDPSGGEGGPPFVTDVEFEVL